MGFQRIARWCWRSCSSTRTPQCDIVDAERDTHCQNGSTHMNALHRSASFISRQIMQTHISDRQALYIPKSVDAHGFRSTVETPLMLGMSQYCDQWRSQKLAEVLSTSGVGTPHRVKQCVSQIAEGVQQNIEEHAGNNAHSDLHRKNVDTPEGKNLFHATAMSVYQRQPTWLRHSIWTVTYHLPSLSMTWLLCMNWMFTKVT